MEILKEKILSKQDLRKTAIEKRNLMAKLGLIKKISKNITNKILSSPEYNCANHIAFYFPIKNEIDITGIFNKDKNFYLPKCVNNEMFFCKVNSFDELKIGSFNILEPVGEKADSKILDLIFIPALLANNNKFRLGYGKGFYDRFFKENIVNAKKIIVIPSNFVDDSFIQEEHDCSCDEILTEIC